MKKPSLISLHFSVAEMAMIRSSGKDFTVSLEFLNVIYEYSHFFFFFIAVNSGSQPEAIRDRRESTACYSEAFCGIQKNKGWEPLLKRLQSCQCPWSETSRPTSELLVPAAPCWWITSTASIFPFCSVDILSLLSAGRLLSSTHLP